MPDTGQPQAVQQEAERQRTGVSKEVQALADKSFNGDIAKAQEQARKFLDDADFRDTAHDQLSRSDLSALRAAAVATRGPVDISQLTPAQVQERARQTTVRQRSPLIEETAPLLYRSALVDTSGTATVRIDGMLPDGQRVQFVVPADYKARLERMSQDERARELQRIGALPGDAGYVSDVKAFNEEFGTKVSEDFPYISREKEGKINRELREIGLQRRAENAGISRYIDKSGEMDMTAIARVILDSDKTRARGITKLLRDYGIEGKAISESVSAVREFEEGLKEQPVRFKNAYDTGGMEAYNKEVQVHNEETRFFNKMDEYTATAEIDKFEESLKDAPPEIRKAYQEGGIGAYNQAVYIYNMKTLMSDAKQQAVFNNAMKELDDYQLPIDYALAQYAVTAPTYDIARYMRDNPDKGDTLIAAGFAKDDIDKAKQHNYEYLGIGAPEHISRQKFLKGYYADRGWKPAADLDAVPTRTEIERLETANKAYDDKYGPPMDLKTFTNNYFNEKGWKNIDEINKLGMAEKTAVQAEVERRKYHAHNVEARRVYEDKFGLEPVVRQAASNVGNAAVATAEMVVPGLYAARHWKDMSAGEKAFAIATDVLVIFPIIKAAGSAGRSIAGVATRGTMAKEAGKAAFRETGAVLRAPVDMVVHPVGSAEGLIKNVREVAENIAHPKKLPEVVVTTTNGTVRIPIKKGMTPAQAMAARDVLMSMAAKGESPVVIAGDYLIKVRRGPLMKEVGGGLSHTTPQGKIFEDVLTVAEKPGMPRSEQGLFMSHEPLPRFGTSSAFGATGEKPTTFVIGPEEAGKTISSGKIYDSAYGKVAELERKARVGAELPPAKQWLYYRNEQGVRIRIGLEERITLSPLQIAKLKIKWIPEAIKSPFTPAIKMKKLSPKARQKLLNQGVEEITEITGKGKYGSLTDEQIRQLGDYLEMKGFGHQARNLERAQEMSRAMYAGRRAAPTLARIAGRINQSEYRRELRKAMERSGYAQAGRGLSSDRVIKERLQSSQRSAKERTMTSTDRSPRMEPADERKVSRADSERTETLRDITPRTDTRTGERTDAVRGTERPGTRTETARGGGGGRTGEGRIPETGRGKEEKGGQKGNQVPIDEWQPKDIKTAVAWKQNRTTIIAITTTPPYKYDTFSVRKAPPGLKILRGYKGKGSAAKSARDITPRTERDTVSATDAGKSKPRTVHVDMGIQDVLVSGSNIRFRADRHRQTTGDIVIRSHDRPKKRKKGRGSRIIHG